MCGIAGIFDNGSQISIDTLGIQLQNMLNKIKHRGPDDRGEERICKRNGLNVFLGHQRLSIIEPGIGGHQPMANNDSTVWISTNSEIYNYKNLRSELQERYNFVTKSDTEVLLRSYEAWGLDCLEKLRGMFAFAIWDSTNNKLILARDRLGVKPLFYCSIKNLLIFSSELRSILATNLIETKLNTSGIFQYLSLGRVGSPETILDPILELPPGHFLIADKNGITIKEYWNPLKNKSSLNSETTINKQIGGLLEEAVKIRLVSDVPLGAFLSGGIDSSAIVGMMADNSPNPINTLSVTFNEKIYDESNYSNQIAKELNTKHSKINFSENDLLEILPKALDAMDQPTVDGINTYIISEAAKQRGLKVALSGLGADELFAGYNTFHMIRNLNRIQNFISTLPFYIRKKLGLFIKILLAPSDKTTKLIHLMNNKICGAHVYFLIRTLFCIEEVSNLFVDQTINESEIIKFFKNSQNVIDSKADLSLMDLTSYLELTQYTAPTLLRDTDMMSMAHGLEVRVPYLDHKLVELMFSIKPATKLNQRMPKSLLLNSLSRKLPENLTNRKKMGFTLPFEKWMRGKMKPEMESVLMSPSKKLSMHISEAAIKQIWTSFLAGQCSWTRPWSLYVFKKWVEKNI